MDYKEKPIINVLQDEFIPYAGELLLNNLPSVADGLLSSQRKVIYAMNKNGVTYDKPHIKMLRCSAMAMSYYVYGDLPLNALMKNMGNNSLNYTYIDPKGSYGDKQKEDGVGASARYIEARLSKYSSDLIYGIEKKCIPYKRNFDNTEDEPIVLPSMFPNILLNTSQSISVSESSKIPAHNFIEVCDCFINYIQNKDITQAKTFLKGCDLSLGGQVVYNETEFNKIYDTGKGSFTLVGKYRYNEKENRVEIYEIPYETYIETIDKKLGDCCEKGIFPEVIDVHDGSDKDGIRLDIYLKKHTNVEAFIKKLRKYTPFESKMSCNFTVIDIDNKTPKCMSLKEIIESWTKHRINCIKNETAYDINKLEVELNKLYGLKMILSNLDKAISIIRMADIEETAKENLVKEFDLNQEQAEYISTIKMINMNKDWINKKIKRISEIKDSISKLKSFLTNENLILDKIIEQLEYGKKKYGKPRMTTVIYNDDTTIPQDALIDDYNCQLVVTKEGYVKKTSKYSESQKLKDGDLVLSQTATTNKSKILFFTNKANVYFLNMYDLNDCLPSALGQYSYSLLPIEPDEKIIYTTTTTDYSGYMYFSFSNGKVCKVPLTSYQTKQNRSKLMNSYNTESPLVYIGHHATDVSFLSKSSDGFYFLASSSLISKKTKKNSIGVTFQKLHPDCKVVEFGINPLSELESRTCTYDSLANIGKKLNL